MMRDDIQEIVDEKAREYDVDPQSLVFPPHKMQVLYEESEQRLRNRLDELLEQVSDSE